MLLLAAAAQHMQLPAIDGHLSEEEWGAAYKAPMSDGGAVRLLHTGDALFVAVKGPRAGLASLCVAKGSSVRILHASAAIGEAAFERWGDMWMKRAGFEWTLRDSPTGGWRSVSAQNDWASRSGWIANASASGSPQREFRIAAKTVDYIGVTFLTTDQPMTLTYWPPTMTDDCRLTKIAQGYLPDTARFDPPSWFRVKKAPLP